MATQYQSTSTALGRVALAVLMLIESGVDGFTPLPTHAVLVETDPLVSPLTDQRQCVSVSDTKCSSHVHFVYHYSDLETCALIECTGTLFDRRHCVKF
jgi:hypothetical protein